MSDVVTSSTADLTSTVPNEVLILFPLLETCDTAYLLFINIKYQQTSSTADLVHRGQTGDKGAFGQLVERFQEEAYGLAYYHLGHREEDIPPRATAKMPWMLLNRHSSQRIYTLIAWLTRLGSADGSPALWPTSVCVGVAADSVADAGIRHSLSIPRPWAICRMVGRCPRSAQPSTASCTGT